MKGRHGPLQEKEWVPVLLISGFLTVGMKSHLESFRDIYVGTIQLFNFEVHPRDLCLLSVTHGPAPLWKGTSIKSAP